MALAGSRSAGEGTLRGVATVRGPRAIASSAARVGAASGSGSTWGILAELPPRPLPPSEVQKIRKVANHQAGPHSGWPRSCVPRPLRDTAPMKKLFAIVLALSAVWGCAKQEAAQEQAAADAPVIGVDEVSTLLAAKQAVAIDANGDDTRQKFGTVPGAVLLSNARTFDVSELPADKGKQLVFYCGSERCQSAPKAASRAIEAGYQEVKVMSAGIRGWVEAGKAVDKS